ncbi:MAG TPA: NAD(P)H-hydrate dehydratase, partial [Acidimicrobiales bacterium]|nr:NAD(P)H-hydrate dehydratase [Acidimicrobiales bacterium]
SLLEPTDVRLPPRRRDAHKYDAGVTVVAGSPGMTGAAALTARAAFRAGAGYVRLGVPGVGASAAGATEAVGIELPARGWAAAALAAGERMRAVAVGPGLGRAEGTRRDVAELLGGCSLPVVVDGDGLRSLGLPAPAARPLVLTPHDGEYEHLAGAPVGDDRLASARALAARTGATVLLKGPATIVADPGGEARFVTTGSPALATAGTGDVLTGVLAAFLAQGLAPLDAASVAACAHGLAARAARRGAGLVASDIPDHLPSVLWPAL